MIQLPPLPTAPGPGATAEDRASFYDQVAAYDLLLRTIALQQAAAAQITREKHAQAQADTAAAMLANVEAQHRMAAAFALPAAEPTLSAEKRALAIALLGQQAIGIRDTEAALVASIGKQVEGVFALWPKGATPIVQPAPAPIPSPGSGGGSPAGG